MLANLLILQFFKNTEDLRLKLITCFEIIQGSLKFHIFAVYQTKTQKRKFPQMNKGNHRHGLSSGLSEGTTHIQGTKPTEYQLLCVPADQDKG